MMITCPEPAACVVPFEDPPLAAEMAAAARCGAVLDEVGLTVAFDEDPDTPLTIVLERPAGEPLRRLQARELLALVTLDDAQLRAWARRPELPIPDAVR